MGHNYNGHAFETHLLAHWAAFFDAAGWSWSRGLTPIDNWRPDYRVTFPCGHSECGGSHTLMVSILPVDSLNGLQGHPALAHRYTVEDPRGRKIADAGAVFGSSPKVGEWEMAHGSGGGTENVYNWAHDPDELWAAARHKIESVTG